MTQGLYSANTVKDSRPSRIGSASHGEITVQSRPPIRIIVRRKHLRKQGNIDIKTGKAGWNATLVSASTNFFGASFAWELDRYA
jgi:hypothetical protein